MSYPDETKLPKGRIVSEIILNEGAGGIPLYVYKAVEPRDNRPYFLVKGNGPATQMGTWLTEEQAQPYLALDGKHYSKQAAGPGDPNDARPDGPEPSPSAKHAGVEAFDPELHDKDADLSITHMSERLQALGITDTAENMHEAVEGFKEARDAHYKKEAAMTFEKYAALKRIATETPEKFNEALDTLISKLQEQVDNLTTMRENLGGAPAHVEGDPAPAKPVPGAPETISAGLQETATGSPEQIEEAFGEFYLALDQILSMTENFADALDIPLPEGAAPDEEAPEVEEETPEDEPVAG